MKGEKEQREVWISEQIRYVGVDDRQIDLFESQYIVPEGVSYNSYLILDERVALMDTVDARKTGEWLENVKGQLGERKPDYLVISHMEPDHSGSIAAAAAAYPEMKLVGNAKTFSMLAQFFDLDLEGRKVEVSEGECLPLGSHTLQFFMAPMVHWPEVMVAYEQSEKVLFSADGFGKFGALDAKKDWTCEARRYYFNIVGKYGAQVQMLLKKADGLEIEKICPLHGPILTENLSYYIDKYRTWSSYCPEERGVLVAYASIHGHTAQAAREFAEMLREAGEEKVAVADLSRSDVAEALEDAFRYDAMVLASSTYDAGLFPPMAAFLERLRSKNYQKRTVALIENGTWAPAAARLMAQSLESAKEVRILEPRVTIRSSLNDTVRKELRELALAVFGR